MMLYLFWKYFLLQSAKYVSYLLRFSATCTFTEIYDKEMIRFYLQKKSLLTHQWKKVNIHWWLLVRTNLTNMEEKMGQTVEDLKKKRNEKGFSKA